MMLTRLQLSALLLVAAVVWAVMLILSGVNPTSTWFRPFSVVVGILVVILSLADKFLWRLRWLRPWLFDMPDLRGTWSVVIRPTAPEASPPQVIGYMVVRQTLSTVSLRLYTRESHSETMAARIVKCDDGTCNLAAVYRNTPRLKVRSDSPLHHGALLLHIQGDPPSRLEGQYWTDRLSQGEITLSERQAVVAFSFEEAAQRAKSSDAK